MKEDNIERNCVSRWNLDEAIYSNLMKLKQNDLKSSSRHVENNIKEFEICSRPKGKSKGRPNSIWDTTKIK